MNEAFLKRIKSLLWRSGMMALAAFLAYLSTNLGILEINPTLTAVLGLLLGEVSKHLNTTV